MKKFYLVHSYPVMKRLSSIVVLAMIVALIFAAVRTPASTAFAAEDTGLSLEQSPSPLMTPSTWNALGSGLNGTAFDIAVDGTDIYVGGSFTDAGGDANADRIARWDGDSWSALGTGLNGTVISIVIHGSDIYAAGQFTNAGGDTDADYVARWDGASWSTLGKGLNNTVHVIAVSGSNVYVGGEFTDANGNANTDYIAKLNGDSWDPLGATPLSNSVDAIVVNGGEVYAGGIFLNAGGDANADHIAKWNGSSWSALGSGLSASVNALVLHGGDIYAGGNFTDAGGNASADRIARWNGTSWSNLGGGLNGTVSAIATDGTNIYMSGVFTNAGGDANADRTAKWDGTSWSALGTTPLNAQVDQIVINGGYLLAAGAFTNVGGDPNADHIARFEIDPDAPTVDSFSATSSSNSFDIPITTFTASDNIAVTGYKITESSTPPAADDAGWSASAPTSYTVAGNGSYTLYPWAKDAAGKVSAVYGSPASVTVNNPWNALGSGLNGTSYAIVIDGSNVYAGGIFTDAGGDANADHIAKWDGSSWSALGTGLNGDVNSIVVNGTDIYAGGEFTDAGGDSNADYIAKWDGDSWSTLGTGLNAPVHIIAVSGSNVYVGGDFTDASGNPDADYIAKLDGDTWGAIGATPLSDTVYSAFASGGHVYVGGDFLNAGGDANADRIAYWNGTSWTALGSGLSSSVRTIAISGSNVYAGGLFTNAGGNAAADRIANWDGSSWTALGSGLNGFVLTIAISGSNVYAGGLFTDAGGSAAGDRIAKWDGTSWSGLDSGLSATVNAITINGLDVYAGGGFIDAGGNSNADRIARFEIDPDAPTVDSFSAPSSSNSLNVPITAFTASDNVAVIGYKITESSTPPSAGATGWSASAPTTYTVAGNGNYTLYPWVKDAAGNVSAVYGAPASVTVDATAPTVTSFSAPSSSSTSLTISITTFIASDNVAVTGYKITESSTPPSAGAAGWTASAPSSYTVPGNGNYTLYPWVKDATGNVSAVYGSPASVSVDATAPTVTSFSAPSSSSTSLTISITTFIASDNVAVTGYKITESSTPPSAGAAGWTASASSSYTVPGNGNYTLYPWVKDATGNVSAVYGSPASVTVDATAPTVDSFSTPSSSNSLDIPITAFTASDNVAVTGYKITESSTPPSAGAAGWTASASSSYTVPGSGNYTLYPWAKDAAGNVSAVYGSPVAVTACLAGTITVTSSADSGAGTLRKAISDACAGSTINFDSPLSGGTIRLNSTLTLSKNVTIDGSALASPVSISGDNGSGNVRVFYVNTGVTAALHSLIITKGLEGGEGGGIHNRGALTITSSTFTDNVADYGGAIFNNGALGGVLTVANSTFSGNYVEVDGGAIYNYNGSVTITNSTISDNEANEKGGGIAQILGGTITIRNSTISGNTVDSGGGIYVDNNAGTLHYTNTLIANSTSAEDCFLGSGATLGTNTNNLVEDGSCSASLSGDPNLGPLQDNGGPTQTMALGDISPAIDAGDSASCPATDQRGVIRPYGSRCDLGAYEAEYGSVDVTIGTSTVGSYLVGPRESQRKSFPGVNNGPVKIIKTDNVLITAAERVIYKVSGVNTSFSELMALPQSQVDNIYWLPWYNNKDLDTQLRFGNVSGSQATVRIYIGGTEVTSGCISNPSLPYPYVLADGASIRVSCAGVNNGPVKIESTQDIVAAERVIYKVGGVNTSFTEMMALPESQLDNTYWLPWYNNKDLDTQLRIANVTDNPATVTVTIGGVEMAPLNLVAGESTRVSYPSVNAGPVKIESDQDIVAAERVIYKVGGVATSFSEMMALPASQLDMTYWLPWYNNKDLDTQLRFANTTDQTATVHIYIGGVEMNDSPFTLLAGESTRKSFFGVNNGPVEIVSDVPIVAAERVIYKVNGIPTSFSEMMGLSDNQLDFIYWLPWYNNKDLDTQLRFGVP